MANQMISRQGLLRLTGCGFALVLACFLSTPAFSAVTHTGTFADDGSGNDSGTDTFTITNDASSTEDILSVVIALSTTSPNPPTFQPATQPFTPIAGTTGYTGFTNPDNKTITLTFAPGGFNPGETFSFTIDVDDNNNVVSGANMAGSQVTATWSITGPTPAGTMVDAGGNTASWSATAVPEPNTLALLGLGLTGLAWGSRRR